MFEFLVMVGLVAGIVIFQLNKKAAAEKAAQQAREADERKLQEEWRRFLDHCVNENRSSADEWPTIVAEREDRTSLQTQDLWKEEFHESLVEWTGFVRNISEDREGVLVEVLVPYRPRYTPPTSGFDRLEHVVGFHRADIRYPSLDGPLRKTIAKKSVVRITGRLRYYDQQYDPTYQINGASIEADNTFTAPNNVEDIRPSKWYSFFYSSLFTLQGDIDGRLFLAYES